MASGAPKKVLTVAMTLGLLASVLNAAPTPVVAQEDDQVVGSNAGADSADLALLHKRANWNPQLKGGPKLPPQQKLPQTAWVEIPNQENVVGDRVDFNVSKFFSKFGGDIICVYGLPPGLRFDRSGRVVGVPTTQGSYNVKVLIKDTRRGYIVAESKFEWKIQPRNAAPKVDVRDVAFAATGQEGTTEFVPLNVADDQPIDQLKVTAEGFPGARVVFVEGSWKLQVPTTNPANHKVRVTVVDSFGAHDTEDFNVSVVQQKVNQAPVVSFIPVAQQATGHAGTKATAVIRATDDGLPNGQLTARPKTALPAGWEFGGSNGQWTITVPSDKPIPLTGIEVVVSDGQLETVITVGICVWDKPALPQYAPIGLVQPVTTVEGKAVDAGIFLYDVDTDIKNLKVEVVGDNPAGVVPRRNADGTWVLHVPATKVTNGAALTELKVTDNTGLSTTFPAVVTVNKNIPTVIGDIANQSHWVGTKIALQVPVDRAYFGQVEVAGLPAGLQYNPATGKIEGTTVAPTHGAQQATVSLIVGGQRVTKQFTWTVIGIGNRSNNIGDKVDWDISKSIPGGVKVTDVQANGLPEGLELKGGRVTGTIAGSVKTYKVTFTVIGQSHTTTFNWDVKAKGNKAPSVFAPDVIFPEGQTREVGVTVTDENPKTVKVDFVKPVEGVTLRQDQNGGWVLVANGTKPLKTTVTIVATDEAGLKSQPHTLKVETFRAQVSSLEDLGSQEVKVGTQIKPVPVKIVNEQKGDRLEIKNLPTWLKFDEKTKTFTGAPTAEGVYSVTVILRSAAGVVQDTKVLTIKALPVLKADIEVEDGETIVNTPLNPIKVTVVNADPTKVEFDKPLPPGLSYDPAKGVIFGTPTVVGVTEITASVSNPDGSKDSDSFKINVKPVQPKPDVKGPSGLVNPVIAFKGDPTVRREIFVEDPDTDDDKLQVALVKTVDGVTVEKVGEDRWFLVVKTDKVIPTTQIDLKVSDGQHETPFATSVTVKDRDPQDKTPSIDNPGGQTSEVGEEIDPLIINTHNVPKGETPKVEGLPEGLKPNWNPDTGVITITGTPTKPTDKPGTVTISVTNPNKPEEPVKVEFPWQVNPKGGEEFGPKGWVDPVKETVTPGKKVEKPVKLADADTPIKDLKVTMTNQIPGVELQQKAPGQYVLVVDLSKKIDLTKALFQVTDGKYITLFETTVLVDEGEIANKFGPTGEVNPVIAFVGDPTVRREVFLKDPDTEVKDLKLELVKGPEQAKLVKEGNRYFLEVTTEKKLETTFVEFKVTDGKHTNEFNTTATVKDRAPEDKTPSLDNPGGQTSIVGKPIDPVFVPGHNIPEGETPKVEGLPEGLKPDYDPKTGITKITGTPTKPTDTPAKVTITVTNPQKPSEPVVVEFPWQVNPDKTKEGKFPPVGQVDSVRETVGANGGKVVKPIKLFDKDTDPRDLVVTLTNPIDGVKLVQAENKSWSLEVSTAKVIPLTVLRFQVSDGDHKDLFENTVLVEETGPGTQLDVEVPDIKGVVNQPIQPVKVTVSAAKPEDVKFTPELPDGLKYDTAKGEIIGTPTKAGVTKHTATVSNPAGQTDTDDFTVTVTDGGGAPTPPDVKLSGTRIQGPTRVETAIAISRRQFKDQSVQHVVIARDDQYADANAGTPFADTKSAPVLLTQSKKLHPEVEKEIRRILKPGGEIWIMGREEAVSIEVQEELRTKFTGFTVDRIGGKNRFETAAMIYDRLGKPGIVSIVDGDNKYVGDALVAGAAMAYKDGAVLYTSLGKLAVETKPVIDSGKFTAKYTYDPTVQDGFTLIGGEGPIDRSISTAKLHWGDGVTEIGVASSKISENGDGKDNIVDALTGGAMVARRKAPMLLTPVDVNDKTLTNYVSTFSRKSLKKIWLYGGKEAVPQNIADAIAGTGVTIEWDTFNWDDKTPENPDA